MKRLVVLVFSLWIVLAFTIASQVGASELGASELHEGSQIFTTHCVGCHVNGGNIVRRGKTLKLKALQKNQMDSIPAIVDIVTNGKANMSAYRDRLTEHEIQVVAAYVLERAEQNWKPD